jgi:hypothetical protein
MLVLLLAQKNEIIQISTHFNFYSLYFFLFIYTRIFLNSGLPFCLIRAREREEVFLFNEIIKKKKVLLLH